MFATTHHTAKMPARPFAERHHMAELKSASAIRADRDVRRERWMAVGVMLLFVGLLAVLMIVALMFGAPPANNGYEYWMMP